MALKIHRNMANSQKKLQGLLVAFREVTKKNLRRGGFLAEFPDLFLKNE